MNKTLLLIAVVISTWSFKAQECHWIEDTMSIPGTGSSMAGRYLETTLKKQANVRFFGTNDGKVYLRLIVTENFYFNKVATLEIRSGSKSYYVREAKQHKVDKGHGLFITEIFSNYVLTLSEYGITGLVFGGAETDFTRTDASQVKAIATCMYNDLKTTK